MAVGGYDESIDDVHCNKHSTLWSQAKNEENYACGWWGTQEISVLFLNFRTNLKLFYKIIFQRDCAKEF